MLLCLTHVLGCSPAFYCIKFSPCVSSHNSECPPAAKDGNTMFKLALHGCGAVFFKRRAVHLLALCSRLLHHPQSRRLGVSSPLPV